MSSKQKSTCCLVDFLYKDLLFHFNYYTLGFWLFDSLTSTKKKKKIVVKEILYRNIFIPLWFSHISFFYIHFYVDISTSTMDICVRYWMHISIKEYCIILYFTDYNLSTSKKKFTICHTFFIFLVKKKIKYIIYFDWLIIKWSTRINDSYLPKEQKICIW